MKKIIVFHILILITIVALWIQEPIGNIPNWLNSYLLAIQCVLIAAAGGSLYCLRAIYVNKCVKKKWDVEWETWYYLRPIASSLSGFAAYIFLKAGLLILEAFQEANSGNYGFLAVAFIAGLNVDKFVQKIEDIAKSTFGIDKSRSSTEEES